MKVVLRADVADLGRKGDVCDVADGYARNYLVPRGLALRFSPGAESQAAAMRKASIHREAIDRDDAVELAATLASMVVTIGAKATPTGHLYGSVGAADIVAALESQSGAVIDRRVFDLAAPIRDVGTHMVTCRPHPEVELELTVEVVPS